jgi:hypothetical protein
MVQEIATCPVSIVAYREGIAVQLGPLTNSLY